MIACQHCKWQKPELNTPPTGEIYYACPWCGACGPTGVGETIEERTASAARGWDTRDGSWAATAYVAAVQTTVPNGATKP